MRQDGRVGINDSVDKCEEIELFAWGRWGSVWHQFQEFKHSGITDDPPSEASAEMTEVIGRQTLILLRRNNPLPVL